MLSVQLECGQCGWWTLCGETEIVKRLRTVGAFRRASEPPEELIREVLRSHGPKLACDGCGRDQLTVNLDPNDAGPGDWQQAVACEICLQPIPPERLDVLPGARRCTGCQNAADHGATFVEPDYCPKCGSILELRVSRAGGLTRYKLWCSGDPPCRL